MTNKQSEGVSVSALAKISSGELEQDKPVTAEIVSSESRSDLPTARLERRKELEERVRESFYIAAMALIEINNNQLFKPEYESFDAYCIATFGFKKSQGYHLMKAGEIIQTMENVRHVQITTQPTNEFQLRPLAKLKDDEERILAWNYAVTEAGGKSPTHEQVKLAASRYLLKESRKKSDKKEVKFKSGSVCVVKSSQHEELLNRAGCWAIVKEVKEDGCTIAFWDGIVAGVSPDELKMSTATVKDYKKKYGSLLKNLSVVDGDKLDGAAKILVQYLEKKEEPVLNEFEKGLVNLLKKKYKKTESVEAEDKSEGAEISNEFGNSSAPRVRTIRE